MKKLIVAAALLAAMNAHAEIYKCQAGGKVAFSDKPCDAGATSTTVQASAVMVGSDPGRTASVANALEKNRRTKEISAEIETRLKNVEGLQAQMAAEIDNIEANKARAANNLAGATWVQSLSTQQAATVEKYRTKIDAEQARIRLLQQELAGL